MSEESISIEETNRIRLSLGLKPIPLPKESSATPSLAKDDDISLDDTNKLRISLGLKPIPKESSSTPQTDRSQSAETYQNEIRQKEKDEKIRQKLEDAKSKSAKRRKVNVAKSLLDEEDEGESSDWLSKIKKPSAPSKRAKVVKKMKPTEDPNDDGGISGVRVGHSINDINNLQQENVILTLKDRSILEDEDELESDLLVKQQKLEKQMAEKLRTNKYKKYDGIEGEEKTLLERYDEEMNGEKGESFILNGEAIKVDKPKEIVPAEKNGKKRMEFSLDDEDEDGDGDEIIENSDYAKAKPIKMKKLKKKSNNGRKKEEPRDEDGDLVSLQTVELKDQDSSLQDDFELQSALALKRLKNQKKRRHYKPEDIAKEIDEDRENEMKLDDESQGIVIDENTEFLSNIKRNDEPVEDKVDVENEIGEKVSDESFVQPSVETPVGITDKDEPMVEASDEVSEPPQKAGEIEDEEETNVNFNGGIGSLLGFLKSKNIVKEKTPEQIESERKAKELKKKLDLEKLKTEIEKRIYEENLREDSSFKKLSKTEKEEILESELEQFKDLQNSEEIAAKLKDYKPEVKLRYIDEYGREMNTKEAYKHLSHQFHGKGPSKSKISKKLKKVEEERKQQYKENSLLGGLSNNDDNGSGSSQDKVGVRLQ